MDACDGNRADQQSSQVEASAQPAYDPEHTGQTASLGKVASPALKIFGRLERTVFEGTARQTAAHPPPGNWIAAEAGIHPAKIGGKRPSSADQDQKDKANTCNRQDFRTF